MSSAFTELERNEVPHASIIVRVCQQVGGAVGVALENPPTAARGVPAAMLESMVVTLPTLADGGSEAPHPQQLCSICLGGLAADGEDKAPEARLLRLAAVAVTAQALAGDLDIEDRTDPSGGVILAAGNAVGGYVVTERMLDMFKREDDSSHSES